MKCIFASIAAALVLSACVSASTSSPSPSPASQAERNSQIMTASARNLQFMLPGNVAYVLEKTDTIPADVAIVYGYTDNREACANLASTLTQSGRVGAFRCVPVK